MAEIRNPGQQGPVESSREIPIEERRRMRHESRTSSTWKKFLRRVEAAGLSEEMAVKAAEAVLCVLEQRLIGNEPEHLEAQLPFKLKEMLGRCELHIKTGPRKFGREEFLNMVSEHLGEEAGEPESLVRAVFGAVREHISEGEVDDVIGQLPADLADLWRPVS